MRCLTALLLGLFLAAPAFPQAAATQPATAPAAAAGDDIELGQLFRSRLAGIEFNPPAGGTMIRELNSGEIVRFVYPDTNWEIRVKPIPLSVPYKLSAPGDAGLLELTATQLTRSNQAVQIQRREVIRVNGLPVGLLEAKYNVGNNRIFSQQAIFEDTDQYYVLVQMVLQCDAQPTGPGQPAVQPSGASEAQARRVFAKVLSTVKVLDRGALLKEQQHREYKTRELWVLIDKNRIISAIQPLQLMRVIRDGKDVGFIQINERLATHNSNEGVELIVRSRVQTEPPKPQEVKATPADNGASGAAGTAGVDLPGVSQAPAPVAAKAAGPSNIFTNSTFFVTFDLHHEDWTSIMQVDDHVAAQAVESANSDLTMRMDPRLEKEAERFSDKPGQATPIVTVPQYLLNVDYAYGRRQGKPVDLHLPPDYLPQVIGQMLPRLLPNEPGRYMFSFYVSAEQKLMRRYVDVEETRDIELGGKTVRAVPISDRIGVDGIPTVQYVSRDGEWLGSVNTDARLVILPTDEPTLTDIWKDDKLGFKVAPLPPLPEEAPAKSKKAK